MTSSITNLTHHSSLITHSAMPPAMHFTAPCRGIQVANFNMKEEEAAVAEDVDVKVVLDEVCPPLDQGRGG